MPVFGLVALGCTPSAFASNIVWLAAASWVVVVSRGSPPVCTQISFVREDGAGSLSSDLALCAGPLPRCGAPMVGAEGG